MRRGIVVWAFVVVAWASVGCSSSDGGAGPAGDAATDALVDASSIDTLATDATASDGSDTKTTADAPASCFGLPAPACGGLEMPAGASLVTAEVGAVPTVAGGGAIPAGTYVVTKQVIESGTPQTARAAYLFADGCVEGVLGAGGLVANISGGYSTSGDVLQVDYDCPAKSGSSLKYQVDASGPKAKLRILNETSPKSYFELVQQ